ncbi:recombination protein NinB [Oxalobacter aliiformigenes]|uniref:recombination protein NinB n=1 Tax=Oxalobacter aliiformigenes TaxID=2946593 RepID=UPI0022AFB7C6|nr:recombination protein NinB [Oxalobacter aliiformigenes]MCZ4064105.1 recombination protein NinB [Oxalobacter aliiformigenes]WAV99482.1 recombination protein NinB [Oxalobacter aliiformigenes]
MKRQKYPRRVFLACSKQVLEQAQFVIRNLPIDPDKPLQITVSEEVKARKPDQNALMWAGPLKDISHQVYLGGRTYTPELWHEYFKKSFLPEEYDPELCKDGYRKWDYDPSGDRVCVGSTTELTIKGFSQYLEQIYAFGAEWGVQFGVDERRFA